MREEGAKDFRADLHCHSSCSDGTVSPEGLVALAIKSGLSGLSITDHDTVDAYAVALPAAKKTGLKLVSGVEFSASHRRRGVHVLGYAFNLDSPHIAAWCRQHTNRRRARNAAMLQRLADLDMPVTEEEIPAAAGTVGRPHIAQAMIKKGYVRDANAAFKKFLGEGKPAYVQGTTFSVEETIDVIHKAGGFAVLAHPMLIQRNTIVKDLLQMEFDGLEGYYSRIPDDQERAWQQIAQHKGWLITGGSDFHGDVKPRIPLGCSWVGEETFYLLYDRFLTVTQQS